MLRFLHTADVLIDGAVYGLNEEQAETRRAETLAAFCDMLVYAKEHDVDLFLVAGNLFDAETFTAESAAKLREAFSAVPFPVIVAPGPLDPYRNNSPWTGWSLPDNVHVFDSDDLTKLRFEELGVTVYGYAFTGPEKHDCPLSGKKADEDGTIRLLVGHGEFGAAESAYCPLPAAEIGAFGATYAALGRLRNANEIERCKKTVLAYAGCPEAHAFDETGAKGAIIGNIERTPEGMKVRTKRIPFSRRHCEQETIDCTGAQTGEEIAGLVLDAVRAKGYGEDTILQVTLTGRTAPAVLVDEIGFAEARSVLFALSVRDETVPDVDEEYCVNDTTILGALTKDTAARLGSDNERTKRAAVLALRYGVRALAEAGEVEP